MDLKELFRKQIDDENSSHIYLVLKDREFETLHRYNPEEKDQVVSMLKEYKYLDTKIGIPRFEKKAKRNAAKTA